MPGLTPTAPRGKTELVVRWELDVGDYVVAAEVGPEGRLVVVGAGDGSLLGVDLATGRELFRQLAHPGGLLGVSLSPDGERIVTCGPHQSAKLWSSAGELIGELEGGGKQWVDRVAWSPRGDKLATAAGRKIRIWTRAGAPVVETEELPSSVTELAWRPDGAALAASCYGGVHIWEIAAHAVARHLGWKGSLISLSWSPDAKVVACGSQDGSVHFWRLPSGRDSQMTGYPTKPKALAWDRDSKLLATGGDTTVTLWDFRGKGPEGSKPIQLSSHQGVCTCLAFSPRKGILASGSQDSSILLWEPRRVTKPTRYAFLEDEVTVVAWHPGHQALLGGDARGTLRAWEVS